MKIPFLKKIWISLLHNITERGIIVFLTYRILRIRFFTITPLLYFTSMNNNLVIRYLKLSAQYILGMVSWVRIAKCILIRNLELGVIVNQIDPNYRYSAPIQIDLILWVLRQNDWSIQVQFIVKKVESV